MEAIIKKYQQRFRKVRDEMDCWDELQICLISQFRNASSIIERLQLLQDSTNYGKLNRVGDIRNALLTKQMCSLQNILLSTRKILQVFIHHDGKRMIKGGSNQPSLKQLQQRVRIKPSLADCLGWTYASSRNAPSRVPS